MKLPDANVLLAAFDTTAVQHRPARRWVETAFSGKETIAFAWVTLLAFVRLSTRSGIFERPMPVVEALDIVDEWLARPNATVVHPSERHVAVMRDLLEPLGTAGNLTTDAHLAAIAIEHGAELVSFDRDFGRFPGLRWVDPATA